MYKEITANIVGNKYDGVTCPLSYLLYDNVQKQAGHLCIIGTYDNFLKAKVATLKVYKTNCQFSEEDILEYHKFLENAGFKLPSLLVEKEHYTYTFDIPSYDNWAEYLMVFTANRYPFFCTAPCLKRVIECVNIHNTYGIPELEALQLTHYNTDYLDAGHELFSLPSKLVTKEEFVNRKCKRVNEFFFKERIMKERTELNKLYQTDIPALYKLLK